MLNNEQQKIEHLLVIEDQKGIRTIKLEAATCSIGRDSTNFIVLHSKLVSRQHAILLRISMPESASYLFRLIDGNLQGNRSTNGLIVNGQRCFSHDLTHGDVIVFGGDVEARYYANSNISDLDLLISGQVEKSLGSLSKVSNPGQTQVGPNIEIENSTESALIRLASFPELLSNPIIEITLEGTITYLNPAAIAQFPDIREAQLQHPILAKLLSRVQGSREKFFVREVEFGKQIFEQSIHYIAESDLIRSYVVDITKRKQVEAALQQAHDELEIRVAERTAELRKVNEQLRHEIDERQRAEEDVRKALEKEKELGELKSRFVTMASHEFRTPLATILSSTDILERYTHKLTEEKKLNHLQRIRLTVKHMTGLLNDVLLIGKAEAGKLEFQPTQLNLVQFCRDLVDEIQLTANNHIIAFCTQAESTNAYLDEKLLRHILCNLLSNAIKYSPSGGTVRFDLICKQEEAIFRIQDEGIGIPVADSAQLFNSFHRASNVGTISGTGLGLAIVKKFVDLHRAKIAVTSEVGIGTTFTVTFPLNK